LARTSGGVKSLPINSAIYASLAARITPLR
jgi:hypothetical protein